MTVALTSPSFPAGTGCDRTEAEVRAIRARRAMLEADLRAEGATPAMIARLATDDAAAQMIAHEARTVGAIMAMFGGAA